MRKPLAIVLTLIFINMVCGQPADTPQAVVERALKAHGGADKLAKTRAIVQTAKGQITSFGAAVPATSEVALQLPEQGRWAFELDAGEQKVLVLLAVNGDKGWRSGGGALKEMAKPELEEQRERAYTLWLTTLLPLKEAGTELALLPETKIGDELAVGLKVNRKGRPEVRLYFDKKTNLLVKVERKGKDAGQETTLECYLSDNKDYDGVKVAARQIEMVGGKKIADWTLTSCKFPARLDEGIFAKP